MVLAEETQRYCCWDRYTSQMLRSPTSGNSRKIRSVPHYQETHRNQATLLHNSRRNAFCGDTRPVALSPGAAASALPSHRSTAVRALPGEARTYDSARWTASSEQKEDISFLGCKINQNKMSGSHRWGEFHWALQSSNKYLCWTSHLKQPSS